MAGINLNILESDTLFGDSPDAGHPDCKCSRCGELIDEEECPIRMWPTDAELFPDRYKHVGHYEYRFHPECLM